MRCKIIGSVSFVLAIIVFVTTSTSFAFFNTSIDGTDGSISGTIEKFSVSLDANPIYEATQLIPLDDDKITTAISKSSNPCIDKNNYQVCSLYEVVLSNDGDAQVLNGYVSTTDTTYTTNNLKCQLFDSSYTAVSDIITLTTDTTKKNYFMRGTNLVATEMNTSDVTYYLAIWLHETNSNQVDDYNKDFNGKIAFESIYGNEITATFSS